MEDDSDYEPTLASPPSRQQATGRQQNAYTYTHCNASAASSSGRRVNSSSGRSGSSGNCNGVASGGVAKTRQARLDGVVVSKGNITVLAGAQRTKRVGSALRSGDPGHKADWSHRHWAVVDQEKFKDIEPTALHKALLG